MKWDVFFGQDNIPDLQWGALSDPKSPSRAKLQRFIELVERRAPVAALPRVRRFSDRVEWYVGWRSESDTRFAKDLLTAFLGRTYADMSAPLRPLEPQDAAERAFAEEFDGRAFRIDVHANYRTDARERLDTLANCLLGRPSRRASKVRPVGRILRDLEFALQAGDDAAVAEELRVLRGGGHLDEVNLTFLEFRRLAAKSDWAGILAHESLQSVLDLRSLPWRVRTLLLAAIYHRHLAPLVGDGALDEALRRFESLLPRFAAALSSRKNLTGLEIDVCFLLADMVRERWESVTSDGTLERVAQSGHVAFVEAVRMRLGRETASRARAEAESEPSPSTVEFAQHALIEGNLDSAFAHALGSPHSLQRVKVLLQCARLLDDESASVEALSAWEALTQAERDELLTFGWCKTHVEQLKRAATRATVAPLPSSWLQWFEQLRSRVFWPGAVSRAEEGETAWDVDEIAGDANAIAAVVGVIEGKLEDWASDALRQALPYVLNAFLCETPDSRLAPMFASLFDLLATDDALTLPSISALIRLGRARLSTSSAAYASTLDVIASAIESADTPGTVQLVADALEMLIMTPCASKDERRSAVTRLASLALRQRGRADAVDYALVRQLCVELSCAELFPAAKEARESSDKHDKWVVLAGRYVAFYSLETDALQRAVNVLRQACPTAKLRAFSETGGTEPMREAARTADLFVIATRSATHAATGAIMQHRRAGKATEYARSKSSTSLIEAVRRWLDNLSES